MESFILFFYFHQSYVSVYLSKVKLGVISICNYPVLRNLKRVSTREENNPHYIFNINFSYLMSKPCIKSEHHDKQIVFLGHFPIETHKAMCSLFVHLVTFYEFCTSSFPLCYFS